MTDTLLLLGALVALIVALVRRPPAPSARPLARPARFSTFAVDYEPVTESDPAPATHPQDEPVFSDDVLPEGVGAADLSALPDLALAAACPKLTPAMRTAVLRRRQQEAHHG